MLPIVDFFLRQQQHEEEEAARRLQPQRRQLRATSAPFELPDNQFVELFRLNKNLVRYLITSLTPHLNQRQYKSGLSIETKVFTALRFYATGCYQRALGEDCHLGLSQPSVHRCIHEITNCIDNHLAEQHIQFPTTQSELDQHQELFVQKFNFPGTIGVVDGMHVTILKPSVEEHNFLNRKGYHSLNVQIIADGNLKILSINANYPGAIEDAFIWKQSEIKEQLHKMYLNGDGDFWLIGNSSYPLEPYLITPFLNPPEDSPESTYNFRLASARNCVEKCIGLLKTRFPCILNERTARYPPQFVGRLINTCATLHNMCIDDNVPLLGGDFEVPIENQNNGIFVNVHNDSNLLHEGRLIQQNIVERYFT